MKRQFVTLKPLTNIYEEDYSKVERRKKSTVLELKDNLVESHALTFEDAMKKVREMTEIFVPGTIKRIKISGEYTQIIAEGKSTEETFSWLHAKVFQTNPPQNVEVDIEVVGQMIPVVKGKGFYKAVFEEVSTPDLKSGYGETFCKINGQSLEPIDTMFSLNEYEGELIVSVSVKRMFGQPFVTFSYVGIKSITGEEIKNTFLNNKKYSGPESLPLDLRRYASYVERANLLSSIGTAGEQLTMNL